MELAGKDLHGEGLKRNCTLRMLDAINCQQYLMPKAFTQNTRHLFRTQ